MIEHSGAVENGPMRQTKTPSHDPYPSLKTRRPPCFYLTVPSLPLMKSRICSNGAEIPTFLSPSLSLSRYVSLPLSISMFMSLSHSSHLLRSESVKAQTLTCLQDQIWRWRKMKRLTETILVKWL